MKAEIISIGSELLLGQISNTDAQYISQKLAQIGIDVYYHTVIGDNRQRLLETLDIASKRSDITITTGGLGPTMDDLTKETVSDFLGLDMELDEDSLESIHCYFRSMDRPMSDINIKQAMFPKDAIILPNDRGTAPGALIKDNGTSYLILPGPPHELIHMFEKYALPYLREYSDEVIYSRIIRIYGMGESAVEERICDILENQHNPTIAPLASQGEVSLRITAKTSRDANPKELIDPIEQKIQNRLGDVVYSTDNETLEEVLVKQLLKKNKTIAVAESCTGGHITDCLTNIPGASQVLSESFITYSNNAKKKRLGVSENTLKDSGAVSRQTAYEMADGLLKTTDADIGIAVTGIAGPGGATLNKPVGLVYIGVGSCNGIDVKKYNFNGDRLKIKQLTTKAALDMARRQLNSYY